VVLDWVGVDEGITLALVTTVARTGVALLVALLATEGNELEFDAVDDDKTLESAKVGGRIALEGLTSAPIPQGISESSG